VLRKGDSAPMWSALPYMTPETCAGPVGDVGSGAIVDVVIARQTRVRHCLRQGRRYEVTVARKSWAA